MSKATCYNGNNTETVRSHGFISGLAPQFCNHFICKMRGLDSLIFKAYSPPYTDFAEVCGIQFFQEGLVPNQKTQEDVTDSKT